MRDYIIVDNFPQPPVHDFDYGVKRQIFELVDCHSYNCRSYPCMDAGPFMNVPAGGKVRRFGESVPPMRKRVPR